MTTKFHPFTLEHPITGVPYEFMMQVQEEYDPGRWSEKNGDPGTPPLSEVNIIDWYEIDAEDKEKPAWVTQKMLDDELSKIEFED